MVRVADNRPPEMPQAFEDLVHVKSSGARGGGTVFAERELRGGGEYGISGRAENGEKRVRGMVVRVGNEVGLVEMELIEWLDVFLEKFELKVLSHHHHALESH